MALRVVPDTPPQTDSPLRQLALQSAGHWRTIAGQQRHRHLAVVQLAEIS
jgi:hypothetical protein